MENHWSDKKEKGNIFLLKLTIKLVKICPKFLLDFLIGIVSWFYWVFSKNERKNLKLYRKHLENFTQNSYKFKHGTYHHFFSFAQSICDKFAAWQGIIGYNDVDIIHEDFLLKELVSPQKGQIILVSHFGNIEITNAISENFDGFLMNILMYNKHSQKFNQILNSARETKINMVYVDELDIQMMLKLKNLLDNGEHIGIMGDRVPLGNNRTIEIEFFGKKAQFSQGAYLLSGLLDTKISTLWCQKIKGRYQIELLPLCETVILKKDKPKSIEPYVKDYVKELEKRCIQTPYQWYNFYDFWRENV